MATSRAWIQIIDIGSHDPKLLDSRCQQSWTCSEKRRRLSASQSRCGALPSIGDVLRTINTDAVENVVVVQHQATLVRQRIIGPLFVRHHDIITDGTSRHCRRRGENRSVVLIRSSHRADLFMWIKPLNMSKTILLLRHLEDFLTRFRTQKVVPYTDLNLSSPIMLDAGRSVSSGDITLMHINSIVRVDRSWCSFLASGTMLSSEETCYCHVSQ